MKYIFNLNDDIKKYSTRKLLALLFSDDPNQKYVDQKDIAKALTKYGVTRTQSAVSKVLKYFLGKEFELKGVRYLLLKTDLGYEILRPDDAAMVNRAALLSKRYLKPIVFYESGLEFPEAFIFWASDRTKSNIKETADILCTIVGKGNYIDIFCVENKIVVLLNRHSSAFKSKSMLLKGFFAGTKRRRLTKVKHKKQPD